MKLIRIFFALVFLAAIYDVAVCMITHANPLVSLVIAVFAVSSWFLLDHLEGLFRGGSFQRVADAFVDFAADQHAEAMAEYAEAMAEYRRAVWERRDANGFGS